MTKAFGPTAAIKNLNLTVRSGELLVLLGPSGSGKTTTLNLIAGLEEVDAGSILFGQTEVTRVPTENRDVSIVFQSYSLYPHLNVRENIVFPLVIRRTPKPIIAERLAGVSKLLGIENLLDRRINQVSGGQRQRVAIAKALTKRPHVFLLDEPFSALDVVVRRQLRTELVRLHHELGTTMVFVTHDQEEAMTIADRIAVMHNGSVVQIGAPLDIYNSPNDLWVAQFIGSHPVNAIRSYWDGNAVHLFTPDGPALAVARPVATQLARLPSKDDGFILGIRPELVELAGHPLDGGRCVAGTVLSRQVFGNEILYEIKTEAGNVRAVAPTLPTTRVLSLDETVFVDFMWSGVFVFDTANEKRVPVIFPNGSGA
ncbi:MAG: ABC transporter ATP-binding protein [Candidatus Dormibacteraceae bacterium]